jgi:hypothetical protein
MEIYISIAPVIIIKIPYYLIAESTAAKPLLVRLKVA